MSFLLNTITTGQCLQSLHFPICLSGVLLISDEFSLVVVEGCGRSIKRYQKLMLRRMDWTAVNENLQDENEDEAMDDGGSEPCKCDLVGLGCTSTCISRPWFTLLPMLTGVARGCQGPGLPQEVQSRNHL
jgi:hypothetical protein